jgi:hypothetical protein
MEKDGCAFENKMLSGAMGNAGDLSRNISIADKSKTFQHHLTIHQILRG